MAKRSMRRACGLDLAINDVFKNVPLCKFRFNIKQLNYSEVAKYAVVQYTPNKPIWGKVARYIIMTYYYPSIVHTLIVYNSVEPFIRMPLNEKCTKP